MRKIAKHDDAPQCLQNFIAGQLAIEPVPVNLTYGDFRGKKELLCELTKEQFGLCGYTGAPVDDRISKLQSNNDKVSFSNHIEHLKCQDACRQELESRGQEYGRDLGEDLDYHNLIAALEVRGSEEEHFGAVFKKNKPLSILPTQEKCNEHFGFREVDGGIDGLNEGAKDCIAVLKLDHKTLDGWRKSAIDIWLDPEVIQTREDFAEVIQSVEKPVDDKLPEFAFVIGAIAKGYI